MKAQAVILKAIAGELSWVQAAGILGYTPRHIRRLRREYEDHGISGLLDKRRGQPSPKRAPVKDVEKILRLYRGKYQGFNVRHFHEIIRREHGVSQSYTFVKNLLQEAGLVAKRKSRGRHHRRRAPKASFGEMLHIDGSFHAWLALKPESKQSMIAVIDDATKALLYAQLWPSETAKSVMTALREIITKHGIPMSLYSDRAAWAFYTPRAGGKVDKNKLTQVGRALHRLGIEHIPAYSPQARGRSERLNRTLQDRLVNEMRVAGIRSVSRANRYIREVFIPQYQKTFTRAARDDQSAFVKVHGIDLEQILCMEETRKVAPDNTIVINKTRLQVPKQLGRRTCAGMMLTVRVHLDDSYSIWNGPKLFASYDNRGHLKLEEAA